LAQLLSGAEARPKGRDLSPDLGRCHVEGSSGAKEGDSVAAQHAQEPVRRNVARARQLGHARKRQGRWARCLVLLDDARKLDAKGDASEAVQDARREAERAR